MQTTEGLRILELLREYAEVESLLRTNEQRALRLADEYSDRWLVKQRKQQQQYRERLDTIRQELLSCRERMTDEDRATFETHFAACRDALQRRPGMALRYVAGWGPITRIRLKPAPVDELRAKVCEQLGL